MTQEGVGRGADAMEEDDVDRDAAEDPGVRRTPFKGAGAAGGAQGERAAGQRHPGEGCLFPARPGDCCCAVCLGCTGLAACACAYCLGAQSRAAAVAFAGTRYTPIICGARYPPLTSHMGADGVPVYSASDLIAAWKSEDAAAAAMPDAAAAGALAESPRGDDGQLAHHLDRLQQSLLLIQGRAQDCRTAAVAAFAAERKQELVEMFATREEQHARSQPPEQCGGSRLEGRDEGYVLPEERSWTIPEVDPLWDGCGEDD